MKPLRSLFILTALLSLPGSGISAAAPPNSDKDFERLFNGKDLFGWSGREDLWSVREGAIIGQITSTNLLKTNSFLIWTNGVVNDFELRLACRIIPNNKKGLANSGVQYRGRAYTNFVVKGYQAGIDAANQSTGFLNEEGGRGLLPASQRAEYHQRNPWLQHGQCCRPVADCRAGRDR